MSSRVYIKSWSRTIEDCLLYRRTEPIGKDVEKVWRLKIMERIQRFTEAFDLIMKTVKF